MDKLLNRSFVSIVIVQIASLFGDAVLRFALPLYVLNVTGSAALMGAVSAVAWLPYLVLTPIGGVAAAYQGVLDAVSEGALSEERIDQSVLRIVKAKLAFE